VAVAVGDDIADRHAPNPVEIFGLACLMERVVPVVLYRVDRGLAAAFDIRVALLAVPEVVELVAFPAAPTVPLSKQLFKIVGVDRGNLLVQIVER